MNIHQLQTKPLQILLSGEIPRHKIINDKRFKYFFIDGRLSDLRKNYSSFLMPWISHDFSKLTDWKGKKNLSLKDEIKIKNTIYSVQVQNKKYDSGKRPRMNMFGNFYIEKKVDIISTDELDRLTQFIYSL